VNAVGRSTALAALIALAASAGARAAPWREPAEYGFRPDLNGGVWEKGPNLPAPRQDAAAAVLGGRIYLVGGFGPHDVQEDTTLVLEPVEPISASPQPLAQRVGSWTSVAPIPAAIDHAGAAALEGFVYVVGGRVGRKVSAAMWRYDPADDTWTPRAAMPIARYAPIVLAVDEKLYVIGGQTTRGRDELSIEVYDPAYDSWTLKHGELTVEREAAAGAALDDEIAIVGGHDHGQNNTDACDLWKPDADRWRSCTPTRDARSDFGLAQTGGQLMAIGGFDLKTGRSDQTTEISEAGAMGWRSGPWMPFPRHGMSIAVLGTTIWVIGGSAWFGAAPMDSVLRYVSPSVRVKLGPRVRP